MDSTSQKLNLRIPQQTLSSLSFAEGTEKGISQWLANLPKANIGETARQLYQGLIELNQLELAADRRLAILELIRPEVHYVCTALSKYYLGQSIVLEDKPRKVANLSQSLQNHLANGYKIVVAQERSIKSRDHASQMTLALQRSIRSLCGPLLRAFQLYCPVADGVWLELHQLYQLARRRKLHLTAVPDKESASTKPLSIEQSYIIALLMGSARPNQMRQSAMGKLFSTLEDWSRTARIVQPTDAKALFIINPDMDCPARYKSLIRDENLDNSLGLDTSELVNSIKDYMLQGNDYRGDLRIPDNMGVELLQHVSQSWGDLAERTFNRIPSGGQLKVSIGMSATHYRIAGKAFTRFVDAEEDMETNPFSDAAQREKQTGWATAFDGGSQSVDWHGAGVEQIDYNGTGSGIDEDEEAENYPIHTLPIVNHSPGGFCLTWPKEVPKQLQAGELLGIQETNDKDWTLAVVRWIRQVRGGGTQMGIELVAPHCTPCAAKLLRKTGEPSQFLRALLLPEVPAIDRPATIITPRMPFQINSKIIIHRPGYSQRAHLTERMTATGSYSQFEYQLIEKTKDEMSQSETKASSLTVSTEDDFDSLWKSL
ncbi:MULTISPECIES: molecular chaperone [Pseudomonas]|uniref:Molecular chaperone n=1 Tax=Pseudomonas neustonica TaxID=2487346 RepID=A0ABX9XNJ3_9PSED|nr:MULTISPECIES: molecular chaperone [Pseudomonas]MBA6419713.1 molecular chaperone [Pseudomonas sp. 5Ae-yellow]ROZ87304.1 molecular chaperone [Pseudomonas sp. SSM44]ROZ88544.1 molecular chaperone [Pseudomonas neustonica]